MQDSEINPRIRQLIREKGYTIYQLSKESSIPLSTLYGIINDEYLPSIHTLIVLCKFLNISMGEFFLEHHTTKQIFLTPAEERHLFLYRNISPRLQSHIDDYLLLLGQNKTPSH